jgi:hypothetical protein
LYGKPPKGVNTVTFFAQNTQFCDTVSGMIIKLSRAMIPNVHFVAYNYKTDLKKAEYSFCLKEHGGRWYLLNHDNGVLTEKTIFIKNTGVKSQSFHGTLTKMEENPRRPASRLDEKWRKKI